MAEHVPEEFQAHQEFGGAEEEEAASAMAGTG